MQRIICAVIQTMTHIIYTGNTKETQKLTSGMFIDHGMGDVWDDVISDWDDVISVTDDVISV